MVVEVIAGVRGGGGNWRVVERTGRDWKGLVGTGGLDGTGVDWRGLEGTGGDRRGLGELSRVEVSGG